MENFFRTHSGRLSLILGGADLALLGAASLAEDPAITGLMLAWLPMLSIAAAIYIVVIAALAYFIYKLAKDLLKAVQSILSAIVGLISALIGMLPQVVLVGLIAFGGAWIVQQRSPSWMPTVLVKGP